VVVIPPLGGIVVGVAFCVGLRGLGRAPGCSLWRVHPFFRLVVKSSRNIAFQTILVMVCLVVKRCASPDLVYLIFRDPSILRCKTNVGKGSALCSEVAPLIKQKRN